MKRLSSSSSSLSWLPCLFLGAFSHALPAADGGGRTIDKQEKLLVKAKHDLCTVCRISSLEPLFVNADAVEEREGTENPIFTCLLQDESIIRSTHRALEMHLTEDQVHKHGDALQQGTFLTCVPNRYIHWESQTIVMPFDAPLLEPLETLKKSSDQEAQKASFSPNSNDLSLHHQKDRVLNDAQHQWRRVGDKTLLVVRVVTTAGEEPEETMADIEATVFGAKDGNKSTLKPAVSVVDQFAAASHNVLRYEPMTGPGYETGVLNVVYDGRIQDSQIQFITDELVDATEKHLGSTVPLKQIADHTMFCLPTGSLLSQKSGWTAFTHMFSEYSFYQRSRCTKLSIVMHELGHAVGFRHSGVANDQYADDTGNMGYSVNAVGAPLRGFNAHKNWISGWFDKSRLVDVPTSSLAPIGNIRAATKGTPAVGRLATFVHADNELLPGDALVLRVTNNLYAQYNRAVDFNVDTGHPNTVTIVDAKNALDASNFVAALSEGESYRHCLNSGDPYCLIVKVCKFGTESTISGDNLDYARMSVYLEGNVEAENSPSTLQKSLDDPCQIPDNNFGKDESLNDDWLPAQMEWTAPNPEQDSADLHELVKWEPERPLPMDTHPNPSKPEPLEEEPAFTFDKHRRSTRSLVVGASLVLAGTAVATWLLVSRRRRAARLNLERRMRMKELHKQCRRQRHGGGDPRRGARTLPTLPRKVRTAADPPGSGQYISRHPPLLRIPTHDVSDHGFDETEDMTDHDHESIVEVVMEC